MKRTTAWLAVLALSLCAAGGVALLSSGSSTPELTAAPIGPPPGDARYVDPDGSDSARGTAARPWRTLRKAARAARPGMTVVLRPGVYGRRGDVLVFRRSGRAQAPIVWRSARRGAMPRIVGHVRIAGSHQRFWRLLFDGPTGPVKRRTRENPEGEQVQIAVGQDHRPVEDVEIAASVIRDSHWHAGIYLEKARDVRIVGNHIHDNGDFGDPSQANQSHGIYWESGSGLIANNLVEHNVARGIQLYERPNGVLVVHNTVVRNGRAGIQVAAEAENNVIANNVLAFNGDAGIRTHDLSGGGNRAESNLVFRGDRGEAPGLRIEDAIHSRPVFVNERSYRLAAGSPGLGEADPAYVVSHDRDGRPRPGEGADLGAYERP